GSTYKRFSGIDRAALYLVALNTGFRASELISLTPASFDLDDTRPTVTIEAAYSKHRRRDVQLVSAAFAAQIRPWLASNPAGAPLGPGPEPRRRAKIRRRDRRAAGIPSPDDKGRVADFHALRKTYISGLVSAGFTPATAKELARHSTITLTMDVYADVTDDER